MPAAALALAAAAADTPPPGVWLHSDPRGISGAIEAGYTEASAGDWRTSSTAARVRALRGYLIEKAGLMAALAGSVTHVPEADVPLNIDPAIRADAPAERAAASLTLYQTAAVLGVYTRREAQYRTEPMPETETTGLPAVAIVGIAVVAAAAIGYCAHQAAQVVDRQLARNAKLRELVQADAHAQKLVRAHVEREEQQGGGWLPLDEATKLALEAVQKRVATLTAQIQPPLSSGLPLAGSDNFTAAAGGAGLVLLIGAGVALYLLSKD